MTDKWTESLSGYLDGELEAGVRAELEKHLEVCSECRATITQLESVVGWAGEFAGSEPDRDVWPQILEEITDTNTAVVDLEEVRDKKRKTVWWKHSQAIAAVFAFLAVGMGVVLVATVLHPEDQISVRIDLAQPAEGLPVSTAIHAAQTYGPAIADLETVLLEGEGILDTSTVRVLCEKLDIIDQAMREAREALVQDPNSGYLVDHYTGMMRKKLTLLRSVARRAGV